MAGEEGVVAEHPAARLSKLRRWLAAVPSAAHELRAYVDVDGSAVCIATYERDEVMPSTAEELLEQLESLLEGSDAKVLTAQIQWTAEERVLRTRVERLRRRTGDALAPAAGPQSLSGSPMDQAAQAQRHLEALGRTYANAVAGVLQQSLRTNEAAARMVEAMAARLEESEREARRLRSAVSRLLDERDERLPPEEGEQQEKSAVEQMVELATAAGPLIQAAQAAGMGAGVKV